MSHRGRYINFSLRENRSRPPLNKSYKISIPTLLFTGEKVFSLAFNVTLESKLREFQYKILNCILYTNEKLFRLGLTDSPCCTFCQEDIESIEHLLFSCKVSFEFWQHVLSWLRNNGIQIKKETKETDLIFGKFDDTDDFTLINHMLLMGKFYLYSSRVNVKKYPNLICQFLSRGLNVSTTLSFILQGRMINFCSILRNGRN